ncbi:MAG: redox-sensitive transcriptional activator SoxR [Pseudomonadota bacterium]
MPKSALMSIGDLAARTGLSVPALRYYEKLGLIASIRSSGKHRKFLRADVRRVSFIRIAQSLGLSLDEIGDALAGLPSGRNPTRADWARISEGIRARIDERISELTRTRDRLDGCIGCGCLSLEVCALYNPDDRLAARGPGPRNVIDPDPAETAP